MQITELALNKIKPDPLQPRKQFDENALQELANSIATYGLLSPIIVRPNGEQYVIVAGERRYRALLRNKVRYAHVIIRDNVDYREVSLIENVQRENLNPIEEAQALYFLMEEKGYTQEELAQLVGKSRPYITNQLRLLRLDEDTLNALEEHKISEAHGRVLVSVEDLKERKMLLHAILENHLSVRSIEQKVKQWKKKKKQQQDIYLQSLLQELEERVGTKVVLQGDENSGKLVISYFSREDLENLAEKLLRDLS